MNGTKSRRWPLVLALLTLWLPLQSVAGQWGATAYGVAEVDTKETLLLLAGVTATPGGKGIAPIVGLQGYHLSYDAGPSRVSSFTIRPSVGLRNGFEGGSVYGTVGYAFSNRATSAPVVASDHGKGVVVNAGLDLSPSPGPWQYQALGSYNFGSEGFWARGRATTLVGSSSPRTMRAGGEVAFLHGVGYQAIQPGVVVLWQAASGSSIGLGGGAKFIGNGGGTAAYFKVEGGFPLMR